MFFNLIVGSATKFPKHKLPAMSQDNLQRSMR